MLTQNFPLESRIFHKKTKKIAKVPEIRSENKIDRNHFQRTGHTTSRRPLKKDLESTGTKLSLGSFFFTIIQS